MSIIVAGAVVAASLAVDAAVFNVRDFGAMGDGVAKDTAAVQRAVDAAGAAGGGEVLLPKGTYLCGSVFLKSGVDFHLAGGAVLKGSPDHSDYNAVDIAPQNWGRLGVGDNTSGGHLILCIEQENVTLRGPGRIDGNVGAFLKMPDGTHPPNKLKIPWRPSQMVWFVESRNIAIRDIELADAPYWSCFVHGCEDVVVERANIHTVRKPHTYNGDGLDIDSSRRVRAADCDISTADDAITLRADGRRLKAAGGREGREALPDCADVVVSNCTLSSDCNAIRIGVGNGRIRDCSFHGIKILDTRYAVNAVGAWSRPEHGVDISRISFEDMVVDARGFCKFYYKMATGSVFDGISFRHVRGRVREPSIFDDTPERPFRDLRFEDVVLDGETSPRVLAGSHRSSPPLAHTPVKAGRWKTFTYDKPDRVPVVFGGWSRAEGVKSRDYCMYLDVQYANGSREWGLGRQAEWRQGTHDWEYACAVLLPKKPVSKIEAYVYNRHGTGKAEFRDLFIERREGNGDHINYTRMTVKPFADEDEVSYGVFTGRKIDKKMERVPSTFSFPPPPDGVTVWTASPMDLVTPLTLPPPDAVARVTGTTGVSPVAAKAISLSLARRERESAQILVSCGADTDLSGVTLEIDPLKDEKGKRLDGSVKWERVGYVPRKAGYLRHPCSPEDREMWLPDPLLPAAPFKVRRASTQGAWLTVYAAPGAKPGSYRSEVRVRQGGKTLAVVPLAATVLDFELSATFALDTAFSLMDGFLRAEYPKSWRQMKKQAIDVMLDHRLNPDDISRTSPPEIEDLLHAKARGMSRFNILNIVPEPKQEVKWVFSARPSELFTEEFYQTFTGRLRPYLKKLEANGLDGMAYLYGFDECQKNYYHGIDWMWKKLKAEFPNLPMMTTTKMFRDLVNGKTNDFHCITTDWYCPVSNDYNAKWADCLRAKGKKVWWYTCCSPGNPFANMASLEYPAVEGRLLLGYLTWLYRADGFLFWHVNNWRAGNAPMDESDTYFPEWNTWNYLGIPEDGIFLYPGKEHILPSIRFANIRDGEEDYEYLLRAEKKLGRKAVEEMVRPLVRSQTDFTRDPSALSALRRDLARCAERR